MQARPPGAPGPRRRRPLPRSPRARSPRRPRALPWRLGLLLVLAGSWVWLSRGWWWPTPPPAQVILVLGGDVERERHAAALARERGLPVVVSGGSNPEYAQWLFEQHQGLPSQQVQLDYRATDTLSNFTSLVDDLRQARVRHALLVTSSDHMERALLVGRIVAGSRGIHLTPEAVDCAEQCLPEQRRKVWGDALRAALWVVSGRDLRHWAAEHLAPERWTEGLRRSIPDRAGH
ncbi:MAG: YdcF family protein [Synechococcaceae cyanobacterium]